MSDSGDAKTLFFEALDCLDSGNLAAAEGKLRQARKLAPDNVPILTNLSVVLIAQDRHAEARTCAQQALSFSPGNIEALLVLADCHSRDQDFKAALDAYDKVTALEPSIAEAHNNRGLVLERLGRPADALASYERALALDGNLSDAHVNRGNALQLLRRHDQALAAYDRAVTLSPASAEAWLGRGNVLHELKRHDEALAAYGEALARCPDLPPAWLGRGNVFCKLKRYEEALAAYDKASTLKPDFAEAWLNRGNALCEMRRHDEALAAYEKALAIAPGLAAAWFGRGNVHYDSKRFDAALAAYDKAIALDPALAGAWLGRGDALRLLRLVPEAIDAYRKALECGGDPATISYYLGALGAQSSPAAPPEKYVVGLFDSYADTFDHDLTRNLNYRIPILLADAIRRCTGSDPLDILDLGCGTGLVGEHLRSVKRSLTGIDLSPNMLEKARQRQVYDHLICSDITRFLETQDRVFNIVAATDVFVYVGDLSPVFPAARRALRDGGLFGFSVEGTEEGDFVLRRTLRYAHSLAYLRRLAERHRFAMEIVEPHVIRRDAGADIDGYLVLMRCV